MSNLWDRCYYQHFTSYLGKPFDREVYQSDDDSPPLQVVTYDQRYPGYRLYASLGLTAYADDIRQVAEVVVLADEGRKVLPFLFVNALFFVVRQRIPLASKFAIGGVDRLAPDFAERFDKAALYFMQVTPEDEFPEGFEKVGCPDAGEVGQVYQGLFISEAEHEFLKRSGGPALEERLKAQATVAEEDVRCSLLRPSCV
jgi:hypothetical protein